MTDHKDVDEENMAVLSDFDQTNGVIEGLEGESNGTAAGEDSSAGDRDTREVDAVPTGTSNDLPASHTADDGLHDSNP